MSVLYRLKAHGAVAWPFTEQVSDVDIIKDARM
jgi:hypothetical protein